MKQPTKLLSDLDTWLNVYLPDAAGKKASTIKSYKSSFRLLFKYMTDELGMQISDITYDSFTYETIMSFLSWIEKTRKCKISTRNNRLAALCSFAEYIQSLDLSNANKLYRSLQKIPFKQENDSDERAYFEQEEIKIFLDLPTPKNNMGIRDHTLLSFMYATGARAEEVCNVKVGDIRFMSDEKASITLHGKGGKTRRIKISQKPSLILKKYISYRKIGNQPESYVFPSQRNEKLSVKAIEEVFMKYEKIAKATYPSMFKKASYPPHSMRHTTAMHMLEAKVPLVVIKQFLGHENLSTTEIYAKLSTKKLNEVIVNWDKKYWDEYMDEPFQVDCSGSDDNGLPDFLK